VLSVLAIRTYAQRAKAQRAAHDAKLSAMAQTYLAAARRKKAAEKAAPVQATAPAAVPAAPPLRKERDCPFCAEPILERARVCKHCGRDVEPLG
jgi:hypothetical protein